MKVRQKKAADSQESSTQVVVQPQLESQDLIYPVTIGDTTYRLNFDYNALADAEYAILKEGWKVNLLFAMDVRGMNLDKLRCVFACAVRTFHPELQYENAIKLVDIGSMYGIAAAVFTAFADAKERRNAKPALEVVGVTS